MRRHGDRPCLCRGRMHSCCLTWPALQGPGSPEFRTWELVVIAVDGAVIVLLFAMAGLACTAVVHWRRRQRIRLLRVGQFAGDEVCAEHGRVGKSTPILYKDIVIAELLGRGTFTLVHRAHLGYQELAVKTLKGRCSQGVVHHGQDVVHAFSCADNHSELGRSELVTEIERYRMTQLRVCTQHT